MPPFWRQLIRETAEPRRISGVPISVAALGSAILKIRPAAGLPILIISALVWELGRPPRVAGAGHARDRRLLLITVTITGVSVVTLIISFLGPDTGGLR